jgi:D-aspartate ligase
MKPTETTTPVVVLRFHHGSLAIARTLGRWGVPVYGIDSDVRSPSMATRYLQDRFEWNFGAAKAEDSVAFLLDVARRIGTRALVIPTSDNTAELVADHADVLREHYLFPEQDPVLVRALSNKRELYHLAKRVDVPTPETAFPTCRADVEAYAEDSVFPVMLKAADGLRLERRTGRKMVIAHSPAELLAHYDELENPEDPDLMLQEYIPGGDDTIWMFDGYFDANSDCVAGFTGRKLRQYPVHTGATSLGIVTHNQEVHALTERFMKAIDYRGILDIGYRYDARDGQSKLLDPNPRIGSTFRLFVGHNDLDVARMLYLDMTGQPIPPTELVEGRRWVIEDQDLISCLAYRRERDLPILEWLKSYRGIDEYAWFARDDLRPFGRMAAGLLSRKLRGVRGRVPRSRASADPNHAVGQNEATHQELAGIAPLR